MSELGEQWVEGQQAETEGIPGAACYFLMFHRKASVPEVPWLIPGRVEGNAAGWVGGTECWQQGSGGWGYGRWAAQWSLED